MGIEWGQNGDNPGMKSRGAEMGQKNGKPFTDLYNQKDPQTLDFTGVWGSLGIPSGI